MVLVVIIVALTILSFRANPRVPISLLIAIRIGFVALVGAMVVGALMIATGMMLVFAGNPQAAYTTGGTLKPTHAVTMHAILVLPLLAWLLSFAGLDRATPHRCCACGRRRLRRHRRRGRRGKCHGHRPRPDVGRADHHVRGWRRFVAGDRATCRSFSTPAIWSASSNSITDRVGPARSPCR